MCGFLGLLSKELDKRKIKKFLNVGNLLHHRGPDNNGLWFSRTDRVYFVHTRLSILDLSNAAVIFVL